MSRFASLMRCRLRYRRVGSGYAFTLWFLKKLGEVSLQNIQHLLVYRSLHRSVMSKLAVST